MDIVKKAFMHPMFRYIVRRFLQAIPVFIGATFIIYALVFLQPGDPIAAMFGDKRPSAATLAAVRAQYNMDKPFIIQYLLFLKGVVTFDFPNTFSGQPVMDIIARTMPNTMALASLAFIIEAIVGIGFGVIVGLKKGSFVDSFTLFWTLLIVSVPPLVLGFLFQFFFANVLHLFPATVGTNINVYSLFIPAVILASVSIATIVRLTRAQVSEVRGADYVRTAAAKGISGRQLIRRHVLRNSLIPVVTYLGADFVALMSGAVITETIFNINGIGHKLFEFIVGGEGGAIVSIASVFLVFYVVSNILIDVIYALLDPRIRLTKDGA